MLLPAHAAAAPTAGLAALSMSAMTSRGYPVLLSAHRSIHSMRGQLRAHVGIRMCTGHCQLHHALCAACTPAGPSKASPRCQIGSAAASCCRASCCRHANVMNLPRSLLRGSPGPSVTRARIAAATINRTPTRRGPRCGRPLLMRGLVSAIASYMAERFAALWRKC